MRCRSNRLATPLALGFIWALSPIGGLAWAADRVAPPAAGAKPAQSFGAADTRIPHAHKPARPLLSEQFDLAAFAAPEVELGPIDDAGLLAQDAQDQEAHKGPVRISVPRDLALSLASGAAVAVAEGQVWRVTVRLDGAAGVRLHFLGVNLPAGGEVVVSSVDHSEQPAFRFENRGPLDTGEFWTPSIAGERVRIEYFIPGGFMPDDPAAMPFVVDQVQHIYRDIFRLKDDEGGIAAAGACNLIPACYAPWANQRKAVGMINFLSNGIGYQCSGTLIATGNNDLTPYFLTARHCISTTAEANTATVTWKYESTTCSPPTINTGTTSAYCSLVASVASCDQTLLMVEGTLPTDMFWAGWTSAAQPANVASAGLHHPNADYMRISFCNELADANCFITGQPVANWCRADWTSGVTEGGSSGSALFRTDTQQLYATLTCGGSSCGTPTADDSYGRFSVGYAATGGFSGPLAAGSDDAFEPNNSCATAIAMSPGSYSNLIVKSTGEDWYKINIPSGATLSVTLTFTHFNGDIDEQLFSACGGSAVAQSLGNNGTEQLSYTNFGASADFYLRVFLDEDTRNTYTMSFGYLAPPNNACANATLVLAGNTSFSTVGATTDGPNETGGCNFNGFTQIDNDVWFRYLAQCNGTATIGLCGANYNAKMAVYGNACPAGAGTILACSDNACGSAPQVTIPVTSGGLYRIRIGGVSGATGSGTMSIVCGTPTPTGACCLANGSCSNGMTQTACTAAGGVYKGDNSTCASVACPQPCPGDVNHSGAVEIDDLFAVINAWGSCPGCASDIVVNGSVDVDDLFSVINHWGACP